MLRTILATLMFSFIPTATAAPTCEGDEDTWLCVDPDAPALSAAIGERPSDAFPCAPEACPRAQLNATARADAGGTSFWVHARACPAWYLCPR